MNAKICIQCSSPIYTSKFQIAYLNTFWQIVMKLEHEKQLAKNNSFWLWLTKANIVMCMFNCFCNWNFFMNRHFCYLTNLITINDLDFFIPLHFFCLPSRSYNRFFFFNDGFSMFSSFFPLASSNTFAIIFLLFIWSGPLFHNNFKLKWNYSKLASTFFHSHFLDHPFVSYWCTPKLFERFKCKSENENNGRKNQGMFLNLQHFTIRGACWSSEMGTKKSHKRVNYLYRLAKPNNKLVDA